MNDDKTFKRFLKVVGIAALVAVPIFFFLKKRRMQELDSSGSENPNIFAEELSD